MRNAPLKHRYLNDCCRDTWWQDMDDAMVDYSTEHPEADDDECWNAISNIKIDRMSAHTDQIKERRRS